MDATQKKVTQAIDNFIDDLDRTHVRERQSKMFSCLSDCYKDTRSTRQTVENCAERCGQPFKKVQHTVETELNNFQEQLSRCAMTCFDKQTHQYGPDPSKYTDAQRSAFEEKLNSCVNQCADDHIKLIPKMRDRILAAFK